MSAGKWDDGIYHSVSALGSSTGTSTGISIAAGFMMIPG